MSKKIKSLALILRSLPPKVQKAIFEQLPLPIVDRITSIDIETDEQLGQEDWDYFTNTWPEFAHMLSGVQSEIKSLRSVELMRSERTNVSEYLEYKTGIKQERPNISNSIARIIEEFALK